MVCIPGTDDTSAQQHAGCRTSALTDDPQAGVNRSSAAGAVSTVRVEVPEALPVLTPGAARALLRLLMSGRLHGSE
jgi:hypothetical protein